MELGAVIGVQPASGGVELVVRTPELHRTAKNGDSIAVNGVCLSVTAVGNGTLSFDVIPETLARSNLSTLKIADEVNLEPSLRVGDTLGGHMVYGHVDATTTILRKDREGQGFRMWCATPPSLQPMIVEKGYVALDGISLTVAAVENGAFVTALIPDTIKRTTLGRKSVGDALNAEADPIARYVAAILKR